MRNLLTLATLVIGVALSLVSYFVFAAPIGAQTGPSFSNPRVEFAATFFVAAVAITLASAVVYELVPEAKKK